MSAAPCGFPTAVGPFFMAARIATVNIAPATICHLLLPARWTVTGMAGAYTMSYLAGLALTARLLRKKVGGRLDDGALCRTYTKPLCAASLAAALSWAASHALTTAMNTGTWSTAITLAVGAVTMALSYLVLARLMNVGEVRRLPGLR
ncbi:MULTISPECIES: polysaccharide biosynthesis C-terminal domain-containing protein [unclassified Streptomyces]|uniref:polysaccharide biosynthesis C-terminal domain-containing protein n=1 Tax=unclassified Streptomyces TaxID=2593676 RepID=UPI00386D589A